MLALLALLAVLANAILSVARWLNQCVLFRSLHFPAMKRQRSSATLEPLAHAQALPDHGSEPLAMRCWVTGGIVLGSGEVVSFGQEVGCWERVAGEARAIAHVGGCRYIGDWLPYSKFLRTADVQPCVLTHGHGFQDNRYCRFGWVLSGKRGSPKRQWDYHRQLAQDLLGHHLPACRVVHHKNWNTEDNSVENLEVVDKLWHDFVGNQRRGQASGGNRRGRRT